MTKQAVVEEVRIALEQINRQYAAFTAGNRIPEDDELDLLKGKLIRLYDKINMLQIVEGSPLQPSAPEVPISFIERRPTFDLSLMEDVKPAEAHAKQQGISTTANTTENAGLKMETASTAHEPETKEKIKTHEPVATEPAKPAVAEVQATRTGIFKESEPTIAQQFHESETIHDKIGAAQHAFAVADKLKLTPVTDLVKAIGINEKFLFISQLFNNNHQAYHQAIEKLNNTKSFADAYMYFDAEVVTQFKADKSSEVYRQFVDLLQRRFI